MRMKKYTRQEINDAMAAAKIEAEKKFTIDSIKEKNLKMKIPTNLSFKSKEFTKYNRYAINEVLEEIQKAKAAGATNVYFEWASYEDNEEVDMEFGSERMETDSEYEVRIKNILSGVITNEMRKVQNEMDRFNHEINTYLALHTKYGTK